MPYTQEHEEFRRLVRSFVHNEVNPHVESWEQAGTMPLHSIFSAMAGLGLLGLEYDPAYGGQGADHLFTLILAEELGRAHHGSLPMAVGVQVDMATPSLHEFGSPELKERYLRPALSGDMVAAIAVTEPDAGSDVAGISTKATRDGDEWVISGSKMYITNGMQADWLCLLARTSEGGGYGGMSQIVFPTDTAGFSAAKLDKLGMRASDTGLLTFDECRVPVANTIGEIGRGFQQQMKQFVIERMWAAYSTVGSCLEAIDRTKKYITQREAFGSELAANQFIQYTLVDLVAEIDMLRVYNEAIAEAYQRGEDPTRRATIAKMKSGRLVRQVGEWALQFHGGLGYMEETWTARFYRDNVLTGIGGGATEVMQRVLAMAEFGSE